MISAEEKIYSPETNTPRNTKDNVPNKYEYVRPENLGSKHLKKIIIAGVVFALIVAVAIVVILRQNKVQSKSHKQENNFSFRCGSG